MVSSRPSPLFVPSLRLTSLTSAQVGLKGGIWRLPSNLHRHPQYHHLDTDLPECDLPSRCAECRCGRHKWRFLSVWVDTTGTSVGLSFQPCDGQWRAAVYRYPSPTKEWHWSLYTDGTLYDQLTVCVRDSRRADRAYTAPANEHHLDKRRPELDCFLGV